MIVIHDTLISDDILEKKFVCDLTRCQGACCVQGDSGAPLESSEVELITENIESIKPFMSKEGLAAIHEKGIAITDHDGDVVTPLINGNRECAFTYFENGVARCSIEKAHSEGLTNFLKPLSCHLYPVRITSHSNYDAVNVHEWEICSPACELGKQLDTPVFRFLKSPLVRKYGPEWYAELETFALLKADSSFNQNSK
jgi:hypothetical protein